MNTRGLFAIVVCVAAALAVAGPSAGTAAPQDPEPRVIEVIAKRYEFVPSSIEVTVGEPVRIVVTSGDGLHGFGIEQFDISKEIGRGASVNIDFTPDSVGEFPMLCTAFCGSGHEEMKGVLVVKAADAPQP